MEVSLQQKGDGNHGFKNHARDHSQSNCRELVHRRANIIFSGERCSGCGLTKNKSHFFKGEVQSYTRYIDYEGFLDTYQSERNSPYVLGYYTHLIADDIWLRGFNLPWLRNRMEADPQLYDVSHQDFRLLNGKLLEHYGCTDELKRVLSHVPAIVDLEEVKREDVEVFVPYVLNDMDYDKEAIHENLHLFTMVQIIGYIETSVELGIMKLEPVLSTMEAGRSRI